MNGKKARALRRIASTMIQVDCFAKAHSAESLEKIAKNALKHSRRAIGYKSLLNCLKDGFMRMSVNCTPIECVRIQQLLNFFSSHSHRTVDMKLLQQEDTESYDEIMKWMNFAYKCLVSSNTSNIGHLLTSNSQPC